MEHKIYMNYIHPSSLLRQLSDLWKADQLCDAVITVDKIIVAKAHKVVLFAVSPKLKSDSCNSSQSPILDVCLPAGVSHRAVHAFLQYIYEGYLILTKKLAADLLRISKFLRITCLTNCCSDYLDSFEQDSVIVLDEAPAEIKTEEFNHVRKSAVEDEAVSKSKKDESDAVKSKKQKTSNNIPSSPAHSNRSPSRDSFRPSSGESSAHARIAPGASDPDYVVKDKSENSLNTADGSMSSQASAQFVVQDVQGGQSVMSDIDISWKTPGKKGVDEQEMVHVKSENLSSCTLGSSWKDAQDVSQSSNQNTLSPSSFASEMQLVNIKQEPEDIIVEPNFFQSITSTPSSHDQGQYEGQMWFSSDSGAIESLNQTAPVESMSSPMGGPSHMNFPQRSMTPFSSLKQMRAQQSIKRSIQSSVSAAKRAKNIQMAGASVPDGSGGGDEGDEQMLEMEQEGDSGSQEIESAPTPTALIVNSNVQNQMASRFASDIELLSDQRSPDIVIGESKIGEEVSITVKCEAEDSLSETAIIAAVPTTSTDSDDQNVFTNKEVGKCISRFAEVDNNEIIEFMTRGTNKHTQNKTTYDLKLLNSFLQQPSVDENRPIHEIPTGELCSLLCKFIMSVRKADGTDYEPNSLRGFMSSFERHLKYNNYGYSLASSHEFSKFRDVLRSKQKSLKQEGKGNNPNRAEPISEEEISLLWQCGQFGSVTPQSIINTMWFYFSIYFGLKSTVEHHDLRWGDVKLFTDSEENEYIEYQDDQVKARAGMVGARSIKPKIYANTDNPERCIVDVFKQYAAKRPPDYCLRDHPFYIATHTGIPRRGEYWFKRNAVGINKLTSLMKRMIESAGISSDRKLSNHSVRKHVMQKLNTSATLTFDTFV